MFTVQADDGSVWFVLRSCVNMTVNMLPQVTHSVQGCVHHRQKETVTFLLMAWFQILNSAQHCETSCFPFIFLSVSHQVQTTDEYETGKVTQQLAASNRKKSQSNYLLTNNFSFKMYELCKSCKKINEMKWKTEDWMPPLSAVTSFTAYF